MNSSVMLINTSDASTSRHKVMLRVYVGIKQIILVFIVNRKFEYILSM